MQGTMAEGGELWWPDTATDLRLNKTVPFSINISPLYHTACRFALLSLTVRMVQVKVSITRKKGAVDCSMSKLKEGKLTVPNYNF